MEATMTLEDSLSLELEATAPPASEPEPQWIASLDQGLRRSIGRIRSYSWEEMLKGWDRDKCRAVYVRFLLENYASARHTSRLLALAASRMDERHRDLRSWLFRFCCAEDRHHLMIAQDLEHLEISEEDALRYVPCEANRAMVSYVYQVAGQENPVGVLGDAYLKESLSLDNCDALADAMKQLAGVPEDAVTFLRKHGKLDVGHVAALRRALRFVSEPADGAAAVECLEIVAMLYAQVIASLWNSSPPPER